MEGLAAQKLHDFERGKISRRILIESLTLAVTTAFAADGAKAQVAGVQAPDPVLKVALVNHISYTCPNYREAADWYSKVLNLDQVGPTNRDVALPFGKKGDLPYNVTATDVPLTHLIIRTRPQNTTPPSGQPPRQVRPNPRAVIDHIAYTIADFDRNRAEAELAAMGVKNLRRAGLNGLHMDDPFGYEVEICGLANNALTD